VALDVNGRFGRTVQWAASQPRLVPLIARVAPPLDRLAGRLTGGRFLPSQLLVPALLLTTTGAKTGLARTTPLATLPDGADAWYVVGSNFGGTKHPGWSANLLAHPTATVTYRGRTCPVDAHLLDAQERTAVWPRLRAVWPTYDWYVETSHRDLRVFHLTRQR
jgi:deazaflavin-dependent oxidoreductase (nitroreductase family)